MEPERSNRTPGPGRPKRAAVYARLDEAVAELRDRWGGLPSPEESRAIWDDIWVHEAHNSTALEGNTLVLREVGQLLRDGRAVGSKQLADYLEVQGYADAASWVYGQALRPDASEPSELLTVTEVRHVHQLALQPVWDVAPHAEATGDEAPGAFRRHDIHPFPGGMTPPSFALVDVEVHGWLERTRGVRQTDGHLIERLAELHAEFERIHPFLTATAGQDGCC